MKYSAEELAGMAKQTLASVNQGDPRGIMVIIQLMTRFQIDEHAVLRELNTLANGA